jgi:hypothetical protein
VNELADILLGGSLEKQFKEQKEGLIMEKRLYGLAIVIILMLSTYSPVHAKNFLPLRVGESLIYEGTDDQGNTWEETFYVSGTARINCVNKSYYIVETGPPEDVEISFVRSTRDKVYVYTPACDETMEYQNGPSGTSWTIKGGRKDRTIEAIETVTVPAGTFKNCLRIRTRHIDCDPPCDDGLEWFDPFSLGPVKQISYYDTNCECVQNPPNVRVIKELKSYTK